MVNGQSWTLTDSLQIGKAQALTYDPSGKLYVATQNRQLYQLKRGKTEQSYASAQLSGIGHLEAFHLLRLFAFYRESQTFQFFDRFLTPGSQQLVNDPDQAFYSAATLSSDQMLWLVDEVNLKLKKYHPILENILITADLRYYLDESYKINYVREYGNRVFVNNSMQEILLFDIMGNFLGKLPLRTEEAFYFNKDSLYFLSGRELISYHLKTMQQDRIILPRSADHVLWIDDEVYIFYQDWLYRYIYRMG